MVWTDYTPIERGRLYESNGVNKVAGVEESKELFENCRLLVSRAWKGYIFKEYLLSLQPEQLRTWSKLHLKVTIDALMENQMDRAASNSRNTWRIICMVDLCKRCPGILFFNSFTNYLETSWVFYCFWNNGSLYLRLVTSFWRGSSPSSGKVPSKEE